MLCSINDALAPFYTCVKGIIAFAIAFAPISLASNPLPVALWGLLGEEDCLAGAERANCCVFCKSWSGLAGSNRPHQLGRLRPSH